VGNRRGDGRRGSARTRGRLLRDRPARVASTSAPASASDSDDPLDLIAKLADLHKEGALSDDEFAAAKAKLLAQD
jgi:hypothetical protein